MEMLHIWKFGGDAPVLPWQHIPIVLDAMYFIEVHADVPRRYLYSVMCHIHRVDECIAKFSIIGF